MSLSCVNGLKDVFNHLGLLALNQPESTLGCACIRKKAPSGHTDIFPKQSPASSDPCPFCQPFSKSARLQPLFQSCFLSSWMSLFLHVFISTCFLQGLSKLQNLPANLSFGKGPNQGGSNGDGFCSLVPPGLHNEHLLGCLQEQLDFNYYFFSDFLLFL